MKENFGQEQYDPHDIVELDKNLKDETLKKIKTEIYSIDIEDPFGLGRAVELQLFYNALENDKVTELEISQYELGKTSTFVVDRRDFFGSHTTSYAPS